MSKVQGVQPLQNPPKIDAEMIVNAGSVDKIEELVSYIKSPAEKKKILKQAEILSRNRPNKETHYRVIDKIMKRLLIN